MNGLSVPPQKQPELRAQARRSASMIAAQLERDIAQDEALRELLSYCQTKADIPQTVEIFAGDEYRDVAEKLKGILDGER